MAAEQLVSPQTDPSSIFEHFRGSYGTELLTAAVAHFDVFGILNSNSKPLSPEGFAKSLGLAARPFTVLTTALRAMQLLSVDNSGNFGMTDLAREHLIRGSKFDVGDYIGLAATSPGVLSMVERLRSNAPSGADCEGTAFIYRAGTRSAMDQSELARHFTLALSGRAKNVAPTFAEKLRLRTDGIVMDVGGGTGIYSIALLKRHPRLRAVIVDRPEVLTIAREFAEEYGTVDRMEFLPADMFANEFPTADTIVLSNILHDWDVPECKLLIDKCKRALTNDGQVVIHDVFLNDALDGPLPIALYSAALFTLTEGRAYSVKEYSNWLTAAGLHPQPMLPTLIHCGILPGTRHPEGLV